MLLIFAILDNYLSRTLSRFLVDIIFAFSKHPIIQFFRSIHTSDNMSNHSGAAPTWITCKYLEEMLQNVFRDDSISVYDYNIGPGSSAGDNYACQIFRIQCHCTKKEIGKLTKSIIAKVVPNTDLVEDIIKEFDFFNIELKMLSETLPLLHKELLLKIETEPFFPHFYKMDVENKMLFMEDLKAEGYILADRTLSLDLDHVYLVMDVLAKMHASSYLLFKKNPEYKKNYLNHFFERHEGNYVHKMIKCRAHCLLKFLHLWPISEDDKNIFRKLNFYDLTVESYERKECNLNVLIHGDCWTNNMMFKHENGNVTSVKLIDFQLSNYNSIGLDLNYFIFMSAKECVKLEHLEDVLKRYYDSFVRITGEMEGITLDTIRNEFIRRLDFGLSVACLFRAGNLSDTPSDIDAYFDDRESENNDKIFQGEEYISEAVRLLPLFKKYGVFK